MKVIFALSNPPTKQFVLTRHNVGRLFATQYLFKKYRSEIHQSKYYTQHTFSTLPNIIVCLTETYMNLSGVPVATFLKRNANIKAADLMIVHDDLQHKFGNVRIKEGGSAQGHNGITSIISALGTNNFKRLQIGIGRPNSRDPNDVANYVLANFSKSERQALQPVFVNCQAVLKKAGYL